MRRGNMGHLTRIANAVVRNLERGAMQTPVSEVIQGEPWAGPAAVPHEVFPQLGVGPGARSVGQTCVHTQGMPCSPAVL